MMIAFNKWYKGTGGGQWYNKGKGKDKKKTGKKGDDNYNNYNGGKDKGQQPVVCYTCGRPSHTSPQCYHNTKGKGKGQSHHCSNKGQQTYSPQQQHGGGKSKGKQFNNYNCRNVNYTLATVPCSMT
eukprot:2704403-Amphidinium_carterae.2